MVIMSVFVILPLCLALAAISDFFTMKIPNRISVVLLLSFFAVAPLSGIDASTIAYSSLAGVAVFLVCFCSFAFNVMGGGDAKLLTASALWFGFNTSLLVYLISVAFIGGLLTISILLLRSRSQEILAIGIPIPDSLLVAQKVPYGIAIAIGGLLTYPETPIVQAAIRSLL